MANKPIALGDLPALVGTEIGVSSWIAVAQERITQFADATDDHQFIHVDQARAEQSPFGGTIAHGFLSLSLLSAFFEDAVGTIEGGQFAMNYGFNSVRMLSPVRSGKHIRGRFVLKDMVERKPGQWQLAMDVTVEIENEEKPALIAEWLVIVFS